MSDHTEYIAKNRCKTENCQNRKVVQGSCLSCYYSQNKPKTTLRKKRKNGTMVEGGENEPDVS
jgi:hypothetical protein